MLIVRVFPGTKILVLFILVDTALKFYLVVLEIPLGASDLNLQDGHSLWPKQWDEY